jgi:hypothetical protein
MIRDTKTNPMTAHPTMMRKSFDGFGLILAEIAGTQRSANI